MASPVAAALSGADVVGAARQLAPRARSAAPVTERERRLGPELVEELRRSGVFRLCVPRSVGGVEGHVLDLLAAVEAVARGDGSAGWCAAIGATSGALAAYLPDDAAREVYGDPGVISGGVFAPLGRATPVDGGYRVSGRWPFASGVGHCDWLMGGCLVQDGDGVRQLDDGSPDVRLMLFAAADVEVIDTWSVAGLRGTGSHDIAVQDLHVPAARSASLLTDVPRQDGPLYAFPVFGLLALGIAAATLGIAAAAIDDLVGLAGAKTPQGARRSLAQRAAVQAAVARAGTSVDAARALLRHEAGCAWELAERDGQVPVENRGALRGAATHAVSACAGAVTAMYEAGGGSAIYESSPLQRHLRDAHVATQHMIVGPATWELAGRVRLGLEPGTAQL
jgi:alkylation response protein AidB-like acyl-CoA dehydrogenase